MINKLAVKQHACWSNMHLNSGNRPTNLAINDTLKHIRDCIENPTIGLLARASNKPLPFDKNLHRQAILNNEKVKSLNSIFKSKFAQLYPKTGKLRLALIKNHNVVMDYVKPRQSAFKHFMLKLFIR